MVEDILQKYGKTQDKESETKEVITNIVSHKPITGIEFRIQCGAFKTQTDGQKLVSKYNITERVSEDYHQGLYKYTVGSFESYDDAAKYRDSFIQRTKIWTTFIVAYKNGKRLAKLSDAYR